MNVTNAVRATFLMATVATVACKKGGNSGAGGGGFMFLYCPFDCRPAVSERLRQLGGEALPMAFVPDGMQAWSWAARRGASTATRSSTGG